MQRSHPSPGKKHALDLNEAGAWLKKFASLRVMVIGDVMLDEYLWGSVERISPEAPVPVVDVLRREARPGGAANVAVNLKSLGAMPLLCSVIGKDPAGRMLLQGLKQLKIGTSGFLSSSSRLTTVKSRVFAKGHQLLRYDTEMTDDLTTRDESLFVSHIKRLIEKEKPVALIFEDYNKGILTPAVIDSVIRLATRKKIIVAVDPKHKNFFAYRGVTLFKPNQAEVIHSLGDAVQWQTLQQLNVIHNKLKRKLAHCQTLITLGERGIYFHDGNTSGLLSAHKRDVSDVSGAGDTVIATATLALAAGCSLRQATALANLAGGLVCEYAGVTPVTIPMIQRALIQE